MPQLDWDETDFLECLEVLPQREEYETMHTYEVNRSGLSLLLKVRQFESTVNFSLRQHEVAVPLLEFVLFVRGDARYVNDKRGTYLEFRETLMLPRRFAFGILGDLSDKTKFPQSWTVQLQVKPHIHIRYDES